MAEQVQVQSGNAVAHLGRVMRDAGWSIDYIDLDLTQAQPRAEIRVKRDDGRWIHARVDHIGRATIERFQREKYLGMSRGVKGRVPQTMQVDDIFLGRSSFEGPRSMLRTLTNYLTDNALRPVALTDMRSGWAALMSAPTLIEFAAKESA